jgi:hypothetical protein
MAAQSSPTSRLRPKIFVDAERRTRRSVDAETALQLQLQSVFEQHDVDVIVIADLDGTPAATAGEAEAAIALADFAAGVAKEHPCWQSMVTNRGFVVVQRVQIGLKAFVVAAQARFTLPDRSGIARAVTGVMRILKDGLTLQGEAPMPLVQVGGWGDWE